MSRMLSVKEVVAAVGLCRATVYNLIKKGEFPAAKRISAGRVGWLSDDVGRWMEAR